MSDLEYGSAFAVVWHVVRLPPSSSLPTSASGLEYGSSVSCGSIIVLARLTAASLLLVTRLKCHRLRHEAALAQHKELEIGKQTRQALVENDALCRTVERLQKSFATNKVRHK